MTFVNVCELLGGLAMFLYGMETASSGMRRASGAGMREMLRRATGRRALGLAAGIALSFGMQSSSAATVMLVGLADAGLIVLLRALPVALGSGIGTTFTVQVIAFDVGRGALILLAIGLLIRWVSRYDRHKRIGDTIFGLGLIFYGMAVLSAGAKPLAGQPWFQTLLNGVADSPVLGILVSAVLTGIVQSSAATIAVVIGVMSARVGAGDIAAQEALRVSIPLILGANIGTCVTALLASAAASRAGKQVALGNLLFKVGGVLLCLPLIKYFDQFAWWATARFVDAQGSPAQAATRAIANAHTFFNVAAALVFLPFIGVFHRIVLWILPAGKERSALTRSLAPRLLGMPEIAVEAIASEVRNTGVQVRNMYSLSRKAVIDQDRAAVDKVRVEDDAVDSVLLEVTRFAVGLSQQDMETDVAKRRDALLITLRDLEQIGDVLSKVVVKLARKMLDSGIQFSDDGRQELGGIFGEIAESFDKTLLVLATGREGPAGEVLDYEKKVERRRRELFRSHLERLEHNNPQTTATMQIHMDVITGLRQIHSLLSDIVCAITESPEQDALDEDAAIDYIE